MYEGSVKFGVGSGMGGNVFFLAALHIEYERGIETSMLQRCRLHLAIARMSFGEVKVNISASSSHGKVEMESR